MKDLILIIRKLKTNKSFIWRKSLAYYLFILAFVHYLAPLGAPLELIGKTSLIHFREVVHYSLVFGLLLSSLFLIGQKDLFRYLAITCLLGLFIFYLSTLYIIDDFDIKYLINDFITYIIPMLLLLKTSYKKIERKNEKDF